MTIKPVQIIKASPELREQARRSDEESKRLLTELFNTELNIMRKVNEVLLSISLHNISQEDLKLSFDVGCKFYFTVTNSEGDEI